MRAGGILFSGNDVAQGSCLTRHRTAAAMPFGCRYRLIDFPLSAMVRAGIGHIFAVVERNFNSLSEHIGSGKDWDLARYDGGIKIVSPLRYAQGGMYDTRLGALSHMYEALDRLPVDHLVLFDCERVYNPDIHKILKMHTESSAPFTLVCGDAARASGGLYIRADAAGHIRAARLDTPYEDGYAYLGMLVISRAHLLARIRDAQARGYTCLVRDLLFRGILQEGGQIFVHRGGHADLSDLAGYYAASMSLVEDAAYRNALLSDRERPIYTGTRPTPPTVYADGAVVKGSLIAEGCRIEGHVENSLLFRGVTVRRGSVVRNSVLLGSCYVGEGSHLFAVCADAHTAVRDGGHLCGHAEYPLFIESGKVV